MTPSELKALNERIATLQHELDVLLIQRDAFTSNVQDAVISIAIAEGLAEFDEEGEPVFFGDNAGEVSRRMRTAMEQAGICVPPLNNDKRERQ